jgi:acyl carrier protein
MTRRPFCLCGARRCRTLPLRNFVNDIAQLKNDVKALLVENLMLQVAADQIADDLPLFGPGGLGLDSVDALQLVVALEKNYGLKIADPAAAKETLASVNSIAVAVAKHRG